MQLPVYIYSILAGAIAGLVLWRRTDPLYLKLFPLFLLSSAIGEYIGWQMNNNGIPNTLLYNYLSTYEFTFYLFMLRQIIVKPRFKTIVLWIACIYPVFCLLNIYLIQGPHTFHTFSYCTGCLLIVLICVYYFFELFQLPDLVNLAKQPAFWICSSLLFFCTVSFPLLGLANYMGRIAPVIVSNFSLILTSLNVLLYVIFMAGFLCRISFRKPVLKH